MNYNADSKSYSLEISELNGILDESIGRNFELFRNILSKVFKGHHLKINVLYLTGTKMRRQKKKKKKKKKKTLILCVVSRVQLSRKKNVWSSTEKFR